MTEFWNYGDDQPGEPGWYPVLRCWDPEEGTFPGAGYWNGSSWDNQAVSSFGSRCASRTEAERLAYEHDPDC